MNAALSLACEQLRDARDSLNRALDDPTLPLAVRRRIADAQTAIHSHQLELELAYHWRKSSV